MSEGHKDEICSFFQVSRTEDHGRYLGLPSLVGKNKKEVFSFIKDSLGEDTRLEEENVVLGRKEGVIEDCGAISAGVCYECVLIAITFI